jgi:hypothetical protein
MQHCHAIESVDHSLRDLLGVDRRFGGICVLFGGDFRQTLAVVPHGSREQIVGASLCHSQLWNDIQKFHLRQNMQLGNDAECMGLQHGYYRLVQDKLHMLKMK